MRSDLSTMLPPHLTKIFYVSQKAERAFLNGVRREYRTEQFIYILHTISMLWVRLLPQDRCYNTTMFFLVKIKPVF